MKLFCKNEVILSFLAFICTAVCAGQSVESSAGSLILSDTGRKIENVISFKVSKPKYEALKAITGEKVSVKADFLVINGDTTNPEEISTRGQSTLFFRRKSYSISLDSAAIFFHGNKKEALKKFYVLSLSMDKDYICNRFAFELMKDLKLFDLFFAFCELKINGVSEGVCMVVERPEDWAIKKKGSPFLIARGYGNNIDKLKTDKNCSRQEVHRYTDIFRDIYRVINRYEGEELYRILSEKMEIDEYFRWIAFNYFVRNGDYTDEVWFYIDPGTGKFRIIPWDYDDLFSIAPHEGNIESRKQLGNKLFYSTEDALDKKIAEDEYLYKKYLIQLSGVLSVVTSERIRKAFEKTYAELFPFYSEKEIISMSQYDLYKNTDMERMRKDMALIYDQLLVYRQVYLNYLEKEKEQKQ